ncbi:MAG: DNA/RNA non-specific endonuclease [Bacilli bacterium]|nr:DNA/RNA non-specific endonuclease [Bacilli bacterium]
MARKRNKRKKKFSIIIFIILFTIAYIYKDEIETIINNEIKTKPVVSYDIGEIPKYNGEPYIIINNNEPNFSESELNSNDFEKYSDLDYLGRCGVAIAKVGIETMPIEKRGSIGMIKPSGWHTIKYDIVDGKYLYNRCHLIGYQLTGENANEKNLITCTRQMNNESMLEFENRVSEYIKDTNNHVLYRVTPIFENTNLLATGIQLEALSVEDNGEGIKINIFIYNVQDGIEIDYKTGNSKLIEKN